MSEFCSGAFSKRAVAVLAAAFVLAGPMPALPGTTGVISGYVFARHALRGAGALQPAPHVEVRLIGDNGVDYALTDRHGFFSFVSVAPGVYDLLPGRYGPGCYPLVIASADQVTSTRLVMYTVESVRYDCPFRFTTVGPDDVTPANL